MRPWQTWLVLGLCLAVVMTAMGWMSFVVVHLDRTESGTILQAAVEERIRLALWRMDSALAPLIAQESTRPYFAYTSFCPTERAYTRMFDEVKPGEVLVTSPLLDNLAPHVLVHFQIAPDGSFSSPQIPTGPMRERAVPRYTNGERINMYSGRLSSLKKLIDRPKLLALLDPVETQPIQLAVVPQPAQRPQRSMAGQQPQAQPAANAPGQGQRFDLDQRANRLDQQKQLQQAAQQDVELAPQPASPEQQEQQITNGNGVANLSQARGKGQWVISNLADLNWNDRIARGGNFDNNRVISIDNGTNTLLIHTEVKEGMTRALWIGDTLLLARRARVNGNEYIQGCWLDWPGIQDWLIGEIRDLLPEARIEAIISQPAPNDARRLAALPVRLIPGTIPGPIPKPLSPIRMSLLIAWGCVLLAAGAVIVLLVGTMSLSERRAAFVSAVTHEMRTPLTTFRMYTEMLTGGMLPTEEKRRRYLDTLRTEAERLSHLVENVLAYARLERNRAAGAAQTVALADLIKRVEKRLADRAAQAGMKLDVSVPLDTPSPPVHVDASAVEQILFNLVDNACKYAVSAGDRRIHLEAMPNGREATVQIRDHGPGITRPEARRLFRPFCKSAKDAANSAPGVGLGLALSRRLARHMGGDLRLDQTVDDGACFVLTLPVTVN